jgi:FolB domain-containing protein
MGKIIINDLEVFYCVGVPDDERARPQRLLVTVEMEENFLAAAAADDLGGTIDYFAVTQRLLGFGDQRSWKLLEKLVVDISEMLARDFKATRAKVEVKKFIIPQAQFVAVCLDSTTAQR